MIIGIAFAISIAVFLTSSIITIAGLSNLLQESIITGAVIGTGTITSYAIIALVLSFIAIFLLIFILKKPTKKRD
jgi:hypothetical protein